MKRYFSSIIKGMISPKQNLVVRADDEFVCDVHLAVDSKSAYGDCLWSGVLTPIGNVDVDAITMMITEKRTTPVHFSLSDDLELNVPISILSLTAAPFAIQVKGAEPLPI
jgi:hypothetical protein